MAGGHSTCPRRRLLPPRTSPLRIAYITETYPPEANTVALDARRTLRHLRAAGHAVQLIRPRQPGEAACCTPDEWRCSGGPVPAHAGLRFGWAAPRALRALWQGDSGRPDLVHVATPGPLAWAALSAARAAGIATSADLHADAMEGWSRPLVQRYLRALHAMADANFVATPELAQRLAAQRFERLRVLGQGVDLQRFSPDRRDAGLRHDWRAGDDSRVLLYVGRLARGQGIALALSTFERLSARRPGLRMLVVGDGPLRVRLEREHPAARFVGSPAGADLARHVASADVLLCPGLDGGVGDVLLQALASGLAVAAFDTGSAGQQLRDGVDACLAPPRDGLAGADAFLEAARRAIAAASPDGALRRAARLAAAPADWGNVLRRFEQQLVQLAASDRTLPSHALPA